MHTRLHIARRSRRALAATGIAAFLLAGLMQGAPAQAARAAQTATVATRAA